MALKCPVKISSVNNLSDARYVAGMGVDFMGFNLDPHSTDRIDPQTYMAITGWVSGVSLVGEFDKFLKEYWPAVRDKYPIDVIQVSQPYLSDLRDLPCPLVVRIPEGQSANTAEVLKDFKDVTDYYLLEIAELVNADFQKQIASWCQEYPIFLDGLISPTDIDSWLQRGLKGIALKGGHEIKPGYKDFDDLADMLEALEVDDLA
ncbi:MAG: hypothetical protein OER04_14475 [Cyclobacteriaceae bacterium]|nr:hypothetical protein [Cyclobacteriaceae bacterium]